MYRFCNSLCRILAITQKVIWQFFLTVCLSLLVYVLANPIEEVTTVMSEFNCTGVILTGAFIPFYKLIIDIYTETKNKGREPKPLPIIIGYMLGIAPSAIIMLINENTLAQIGTLDAITFIAHFAFLYFVVAMIRAVAVVVASFSPDDLSIEHSNP